MKTVATYPAFDVVDLETEVIHLSAEVCNDRLGSGIKFCTAYESRRHGTLYREVSPNCIDYYCADIYTTPEEMAAQIAKSAERKDPRFWFNNCGACITAQAMPHYTMFLIQEGQLVTMAGHTLRVRIVGDYIRLDVVEQAAAA